MDHGRRRAQESSTVNRRGTGKRPFEAFEQIRQVRPGQRQPGEVTAVESREPELEQRPRQRAREAGRRRYRLEVFERRIPDGVEHGPRGDRLGAQAGARRGVVGSECRNRSARSQLREAEAHEAERGRALFRDTARKVVGGTASGRDDRDLMMGGQLSKELDGGGETFEGGRRLYDTKRAGISHSTILPRRDLPGIRYGGLARRPTGE
jgi:hypothetical protein